MRARLFAILPLFPLAFLVVSLALSTVGLAADPCPDPLGGGC